MSVQVVRYLLALTQSFVLILLEGISVLVDLDMSLLHKILVKVSLMLTKSFAKLVKIQIITSIKSHLEKPLFFCFILFCFVLFCFLFLFCFCFFGLFFSFLISTICVFFFHKEQR